MRGNRSKSSKQQSVSGSLLLAHPTLQEPTFRHAVILISEHDEEGAMGVVLNRPVGRSLGTLSGDFALGSLAQVPIFQGGPVHDRQLILVAWETQDDGFRMHFGIEPNRAEECLKEGMQIRAFMGYAGWTGGQLENELKHNTWIISDIPEDLIESPQDEQLWRKVLGAKGEDWRLLADEPDEPELN
ncbi:MAG: YqgE/AlgH family protein [Cephaloticoccus sp.]|nr:YqgE/AlgH family protein [Cephaloticoccus sp.]MCF7760275.1 YqgE/AlgH family protein [Cephaloticoccus sp.]